MTKIQKIMFWVFSGLFLLPEILWSPIGNFAYSWFMPLDRGSVQTFRNNFLLETQNINIFSFILFLQLLGIVAVLLWLIIFHRYIAKKTILWLGLVSSFLLSVITFFCFGLSISLRNMGF